MKGTLNSPSKYPSTSLLTMFLFWQTRDRDTYLNACQRVFWQYFILADSRQGYVSKCPSTSLLTMFLIWQTRDRDMYLNARQRFFWQCFYFGRLKTGIRNKCPNNKKYPLIIVASIRIYDTRTKYNLIPCHFSSLILNIKSLISCCANFSSFRIHEPEGR